MQRKYFNHIIYILLIMKGLHAYGQESMALYYLENVPQSNLLNPALTPRCNSHFGLPGINAFYTNIQTDVSPKAFLQNTDSGTVTLTSKFFDYAKFNRVVGKGITLRNYTMLSPLNIGFRGKNDGYFTFTLTEKIKLNSILPTDFFNIIDRGLPSGSSIDLSRFGIDAQVYQEFAFGYSQNIIKKLRVGAKFKVLQGFNAVKTNFKTFELNTSQEVWNFALDGDIFSSAPLSVSTNAEGIIDSVSISDSYSDADPVDMVMDNLLNFSNLGFAADFGAVFDLNRSWSFSASLVDLGFIRWKKDLNSFHFDGTYEFTGLQLDGIESENIDTAINSIFDSLNYFNGQAGNETFSTGLGTSLYIGSQYNVSHSFSLGLLSRTTFDKDYFYQAFNLSANFNLYHILTSNFNYNFSLTGEQYAGFGFGLKILSTQFYLILDHIPITFTNYTINDNDPFFGPYEIRSFNIMIGFNTIFGTRGYRDKPKIDAYSEL